MRSQNLSLFPGKRITGSGTNTAVKKLNLSRGSVYTAACNQERKTGLIIDSMGKASKTVSVEPFVSSDHV